jgi:drug/metabolite transporter (DMT)-like permease
MINTVYLYALGANIFFALGSLVFTIFSRSVSVSWMNSFKALIALAAFGGTVSIFYSWNPFILKEQGLFFISGLIGLGIGDLFLLKAFSYLGPGRTMMLFAFQPLLMGIMGKLIFDQTMDTSKLWSIVFFISCVVIFSLESLRNKGKGEGGKGSLYAFLGMGLDALGVVLSRIVFDENPNMTPFEGNFYRCVGALAFFYALSFVRPFHFVQKFKELDLKKKVIVSLGSLIGTYLSLSLYLKALKTADLAVLSGMAITSVLYASLFECVWEKKWPSGYLVVSFLFFLVGMKFLFFL